jgi:hypothetical protein
MSNEACLIPGDTYSYIGKLMDAPVKDRLYQVMGEGIRVVNKKEL